MVMTNQTGTEEKRHRYFELPEHVAYEKRKRLIHNY
jgi:hypothetical protein